MLFSRARTIEKLGSADSTQTASFFAYIAIFLVVITVVGWLKLGAMTSDGMILDDLELYYPSVYGETDKDSLYFSLQDNTYFKFYSATNSILFEPYRVRIFYLILGALTAVLLFYLLSLSLRDRLAAFVLSLLAVLTPTSAISILFINGSYNLVFGTIYLIGLAGQFRLWSCFEALSRIERYLLFFGSTGVIALSVLFTSNGVLMPFALVFLPWWRSSLYLNFRRQFVWYALGYLVICAVAVGLRIQSNLEHPYTQMDARISYEIWSLVAHAIELSGNVFTSYFENFLVTGIPYALDLGATGVKVAFLVVGLIVTILMAALVSRGCRTYFRMRLPQLYAMLFVAVCLVLSTGPITPNTILHLWHYALPASLIALFVGLGLYLLVPRWLFLALSIALLCTSVVRLYEQRSNYESSFAELDKLVERVEEVSVDWVDGSSVLIVADKVPYMSGLGWADGIRDLNFLKFYGANKSLHRAAIATPGAISNIIDIEAVTSRPLFTYRFFHATGELQPIDRLIVERKSGYIMYDTSDGKPGRVVGSGAPGTVESLLAEKDISPLETLRLGAGPAPDGVEYAGPSTLLGTRPIVSEALEVSEDSLELTYELLLKSEFDGCEEDGSKGETCPAMPMLAPPLAMYQPSAGKFMLQVRTGEGDRYAHFSFQQQKWQKLKLVFRLDSESLTIYLNDRFLDTFADVKITPGDIGAIQLGRGYKQRNWAGRLGHFQLNATSETGRTTIWRYPEAE